LPQFLATYIHLCICSGHVIFKYRPGLEGIIEATIFADADPPRMPLVPNYCACVNLGWVGGQFNINQFRLDFTYVFIYITMQQAVCVCGEGGVYARGGGCDCIFLSDRTKVRKTLI
jgi:hypothetical protein